MSPQIMTMWGSYLPSSQKPQGFDYNFDYNPGGSQQHAADESEPTTVSSEYARTLADGNGQGFTRLLISWSRVRILVRAPPPVVFKIVLPGGAL